MLIRIVCHISVYTHLAQSNGLDQIVSRGTFKPWLRLPALEMAQIIFLQFLDSAINLVGALKILGSLKVC